MFALDDLSHDPEPMTVRHCSHPSKAEHPNRNPPGPVRGLLTTKICETLTIIASIKSPMKWPIHRAGRANRAMRAGTVGRGPSGTRGGGSLVDDSRRSSW